MSNLKDVQSLKLYQYQICPDCSASREAILKTGIYIEERDVKLNEKYRRELIDGGGKPQVPSLRVEKEGEVEWLYESKEIIDFLHEYVTQLALDA